MLDALGQAIQYIKEVKQCLFSKSSRGSSGTTKKVNQYNEIINCLWLVWIHSREYVVLEGHLLISSDPSELGQCWATLGPELLQSQH